MLLSVCLRAPEKRAADAFVRFLLFLAHPHVGEDIHGDAVADTAVFGGCFVNGLLISLPVQRNDLTVLHLPGLLPRFFEGSFTYIVAKEQKILE